MSILENSLNKHTKKINKLEKLKGEISPLDFYAQLEEFCNAPYKDITLAQSKYVLKCFGLYVKGENHFMLRVRIPAGQLEFYQAIELGHIAKDFGDNYIDITTRQQIELRFLQQKDLWTVLQRLEKIGLSSFQTGIDNIRNIVTSSFDGIHTTNYITCKMLVKELENIFFKKEEYIGLLPRKFNTGILGTSLNDCNIYGHDCSFVVAKKFDEIGFNLYLGGKVGVQAMDSGLFVKKEQVTSVFKAIIHLFKQFGFKDNRNKNRLHFLIQEVGLENFCLALQEEAKLELLSSGELLVNEDLIIQKEGCISLKNNKKALHFPIPSGIFTGTAMAEAGYLAEDTKSLIRLSVEQSFYLICEESDIEYIKNSPLYKKYASFQNIYFNNQIACPGIKACPFGVIDSKFNAIEMAYYLNEHVPIEHGKVRMYWSACPNGCGINGIADIGFEGVKIKDKNGKIEVGVKIFIGGKASWNVQEARILHKGTSFKKAQEIVKNLLTIYKNEKEEKESFEAFESRIIASIPHEELCKRIGA